MFCEKCGSKLNEDDIFCPICGNKVEAIINQAIVSTIDENSIQSDNPIDEVEPTIEVESEDKLNSSMDSDVSDYVGNESTAEKKTIDNVSIATDEDNKSTNVAVGKVNTITKIKNNDEKANIEKFNIFNIPTLLFAILSIVSIGGVLNPIVQLIVNGGFYDAPISYLSKFINLIIAPAYLVGIVLMGRKKRDRLETLYLTVGAFALISLNWFITFVTSIKYQYVFSRILFSFIFVIANFVIAGLIFYFKNNSSKKGLEAIVVVILLFNVFLNMVNMVYISYPIDVQLIMPLIVIMHLLTLKCNEDEYEVFKVNCKIIRSVVNNVAGNTSGKGVAAFADKGNKEKGGFSNMENNNQIIDGTTPEIDENPINMVNGEAVNSVETTNAPKHSAGSVIGNILWFIFGGFISALIWAILGVIMYITIIGIPLGKQSFKFAKLSLNPFGKEIVYGGKTGSVILNIFWILLEGWYMALGNALLGVIMCITIIGIPFGLQYFKFAKLSLMPFGATIQDKIN